MNTIWLWTICKYLGAVVIAVGWIGNDPYYMGRDIAIPLTVLGIVMFANGWKGELLLQRNTAHLRALHGRDVK